ncbi:MAG: hypothetical protein ACKVOR_12880 [Flavobacteriales bacterium]
MKKILISLVCSLCIAITCVSQKSKPQPTSSVAPKAPVANTQPAAKQESKKVEPTKIELDNSTPKAESAKKPVVKEKESNKSKEKEIIKTNEKEVTDNQPAKELKPVTARMPVTIETESNKSNKEETKEPVTTATEQPHPLPATPNPNPTDDEICTQVMLNPDVYSYSCVYNNCQWCCRCNNLWYYRWYHNFDKDCNWTGDLTMVNSTTDTLELYTETHHVMDMPTLNTDANSSIANRELYTALVLVPGDSLTFKMPCGALKYEVVQHKEHDEYAQALHHIGWVRSVSFDVRVAIRPDDLK